MLKAFRLIRNVGQFDSVAAADVSLAPLTLIYAENGRGKTTLAAILRSLSSGDAAAVTERHRLGATHPPHVIIDWEGPPAQPVTFQNGAWSRAVAEISVFDDSFVDQNVYSGLVVGAAHRQNLHELILGARGVALVRELQNQVQAIEKHNQSLRQKSSAIPATARATYSVDAFCALPARTDIDSELREARRKLDAASEKTPIRNASNIQAISLPDFALEAIQAVLATSLADLDEAAAAKVQEHLAQQGPGAQAWVEDGLSRTSEAGDESRVCPFCAQDLGGSPVLAHYRAFFSQSYADLKRSIQGALDSVRRMHSTDVPVTLEREARAMSERQQFWSRYCELPALQLDTVALAGAWQAARDEVIGALELKQAAPLESSALSGRAREALSAYDAQKALLAQLDDEISQANIAIELVKEQSASADTTTLAADLAGLEAIRTRHEPTIATLCDAYLEEKAAKSATEELRERAKSALEQHRTSAFPGYQTAINLYLSKFNAGFRIDEVSATNTRGGPACNYSVVINNVSVPVGGQATPGTEHSFRNTLSAGDRNSLALAFFFASLDQDLGLADRIVVIDDPASSLDEHRTLATVHEVKQLALRAKQVIVLSHTRSFLCRIWTGADRATSGAIEVSRDAIGSTLTAWEIDEDALTEHDRRHALLREFIAGGSADPRQAAQSIRPLLETFLRVAYPHHFLPGMLLGPFRGLCKQRLGGSDEILNAADTQELEELTDYANSFHHETNAAWQTVPINDTELRGFAQRALDFARR